MALVTLTGTISAADVNTNFDDEVSNIETENSAGRANMRLEFAGNVDSSTALAARVTEFKLPDDMQLVSWHLITHTTTASQEIAAFLEPIAGDTRKDADRGTAPEYLGPDTVTLTQTTSATFEEQTDEDKDPGGDRADRTFLRKGVWYRIRVTNDNATGAFVQVVLELKTSPRRQ